MHSVFLVKSGVTLFKKLRGSDEELIKTNMTISGVGQVIQWELKA
jgi:hypothetical protein